MTDHIVVIGWDEDPDTKKICASLDLNQIPYKYYNDGAPKKDEQAVITLGRVGDINIDFFGWKEEAIKFLVENYPYPTIIEHKEN